MEGGFQTWINKKYAHALILLPCIFSTANSLEYTWKLTECMHAYGLSNIEWINSIGTNKKKLICKQNALKIW